MPDLQEILLKIKNKDDVLNKMAKIWKCHPKDLIPRMQKAIRLLKETEDLLNDHSRST